MGKQVIYLSGIVNETELSKHLSSCKNVEDILAGSTFALTTLRAGIIVGSGSASFEIIRDLVKSMKIEVICKPNNLATLLGISLINYDTSIKLAFDKIEQNQVLSSWKDAQTSDIFKNCKFLIPLYFK